MKSIKSFLPLTGSLLLALCCVASANTILDVTTSILVTDPTQMGRLSRNGIPQNWANDEGFPGVINTGVTYHYETFTIAAATLAPARFVQITLDHRGSAQGTLFVAA